MKIDAAMRSAKTISLRSSRSSVFSSVDICRPFLCVVFIVSGVAHDLSSFCDVGVSDDFDGYSRFHVVGVILARDPLNYFGVAVDYPGYF